MYVGKMSPPVLPLRKPKRLLDDLKKIAQDYPDVLADLEKIEIGQELILNKSHTFTAEYCESLIKRMLSAVSQLPVDRIYEVVACFASVMDTFYRILYFDEYGALLAHLPGGRNFSTVDWNAKYPNDPRYILSQLEMRKKIPSSFTYTIETTHGWRYVLRLGKMMNAFGCSHPYGKRSSVTFYFEDESDEMLMRVRYPSRLIEAL